MTVIAVTGASGFIGRHFREEAARVGVGIVPIASSSLLGADADSSAARKLAAAMRGTDAVVHLAARAHVLHEHATDADEAFQRSNVELTQQIATAAIESGVRRFVFVSSAGVLGNASPPQGFYENSAPNPYDAYTRSKLAAEQWLEKQRAKVEVVIVRPPLVYGPEARGNFGRLLRGATAGWPLPVRSLAAPRSLIGVRNFSRFLLVCATHSEAPGPPLLIADRETTSLGSLHAEIAGLANMPNRAISVPGTVLAFGLRAIGKDAEAARLTHAFVVRTGRAHQQLGWVPPHSRAEELAWAVKTHVAVR